MENVILTGNPVSKGNLKKIVVYRDRLVAKDFFMPPKEFLLADILLWSEVQVVQNPGNIQYLRLTIYTAKKKYTILSLHWNNYVEIRDLLIANAQHIEEKAENNIKLIVLFILGIAALVGSVFLIDYFEMQSLLKNGIRAKAEVTGKFYEINTDNNDTTSYSFRLSVLPDTANGKLDIKLPDRLQAIVKQKAFNTYHEGSIVNVVYDKADLDHAKLVEEIE